jgi:hypothetical protein
MNEALHTFLVFGSVALATIAVAEVLRLIHTYRLRVNRAAIAEANGRCVKLSEENAMLWSQVTANASQTYVNTETIKRLMSENDILAKENDDFRNGTPVKEPIRVKRFRH